MGRSVLGSGSEYDTHMHTLTDAQQPFPDLLTCSHRYILNSFFLFTGQWGTGGAVTYKVTSVSVISIKAKRTTAHCNSQQTESTTAVNSSSLSEATGGDGEKAGTEKERATRSKRGKTSDTKERGVTNSEDIQC